jgi:hypothetical protein
LLYQRVGLQKNNKKYEYLDLLALFTALYLKAEAENITRRSKVRLLSSLRSKLKTSPPNPWKDFLRLPDIKIFTRSDLRGYLLALSETLTDAKVLCNGGKPASRHIELGEAKSRVQAAEEKWDRNL